MNKNISAVSVLLCFGFWFGPLNSWSTEGTCVYDNLNIAHQCVQASADKKNLENKSIIAQAACLELQNSKFCRDTIARYPFLAPQINTCDLDSLCGAQTRWNSTEALQGCQRGIKNAYAYFGKKIPQTTEEADRLISNFGKDAWAAAIGLPGFTWETLKSCVRDQDKCSPSSIKKALGAMSKKAQSEMEDWVQNMDRFDCLTNEGRFELFCYQSKILSMEVMLGVVPVGLVGRAASEARLPTPIIKEPGVQQQISGIEIKAEGSAGVGIQKLKANYGDRVQVFSVFNDNKNLPTYVVKDSRNGMVMGTLSISYEEKSKTIKMDSIFTKQQYREMGVSETLFEAAIQEFPNTQFIEADNLEGTNRAAVEMSLAKGGDLETAIKQTPAYKIRQKFGFSEIVPKSITKKDYGFKVRKPKL